MDVQPVKHGSPCSMTVNPDMLNTITFTRLATNPGANS
jgi:hypothetical protein